MRGLEGQRQISHSCWQFLATFSLSCDRRPCIADKQDLSKKNCIYGQGETQVALKTKKQSMLCSGGQPCSDAQLLQASSLTCCCLTLVRAARSLLSGSSSCCIIAAERASCSYIVLHHTSGGEGSICMIHSITPWTCLSLAICSRPTRCEKPGLFPTQLLCTFSRQ